MSSETATNKRFVPGAPPPAPLSKTQKKKRRGVAKKDSGAESEPETPATNSVKLPDAHAAALTEKAPEEKDVKSGAVAEELVAKPPEAPKSEAGGDAAPGSVKPSPVVDLLNKRMKALGKKITRIHAYSDKPQSELNDDQKKTLATLPSLEAVRKELEEVKKAVETLEAENARDAALARAAAEEAERRKIAETVAEAQRAHVERTAQIVDFIRFHSLLSNADPTVQALNLVEAEINAIYASANALLSQEMESKHAVLHGLLHGEGEIEGVAYGRLLEILDAHSHSTVEEVTEEVAAAVAEVVAEAEADAIEQAVADSISPAVSGIPNTSGGLSFRFVQESELENDPVEFENGAEWVEREDAPPEKVEVNVTVVQETYISDQPAEPEVPESADNGGLNWADDEGELPSIDGLHRTFGTSGSGTPADVPASTEQQAGSTKEPAQSSEAAAAAPNGQAQAAASEDDGFTRATGGRGRGRGRGFRGGDRGGFRGGDRGTFRGRGQSSLFFIVVAVVHIKEAIATTGGLPLKEANEARVVVDADEVVMIVIVAEPLVAVAEVVTTIYANGTFTSTTVGATVKISFYGTGIWIWGGKRPNHGYYSVTVDGDKSDLISGRRSDGIRDLDIWGGWTFYCLVRGRSISKPITWESDIGSENATLTSVTTDSSNFEASGSGGRSAAENDDLGTKRGIYTTVPGDSLEIVFEFMFYGANLGSGQHTLKLTNSELSNGTLVIDHARTHLVQTSAAIEMSSSSSGNSGHSLNKALVGGLCGALAFLVTLLVALFLWVRRRRRVAIVSRKTDPSAFEAFDIDQPSLPPQVTMRQTSLSDLLLGAMMGRGPPSDVSGNSHRTAPSTDSQTRSHKNPAPTPFVEKPDNNRRKAVHYNLRTAPNEPSPMPISGSKPPYKLSNGNASNRRLPRDVVTKPSGKTHTDRRRKDKPAKKHRRPLPERPGAPSGTDRVMNITRAPPPPSHSTQPHRSTSMLKGRRRTTGSAYAPTTVLTSEISERPTTTLSPVTEAPPPLPPSRPPSPMPSRPFQIVNRVE
ncbi:hypothetical protein A7U60_g4101 [Sanghuangporus baumii]|uniref:Uncharacterized protein n=1 Tax=Sanghuangporus baumii TaxID=108892 RepID=A0A9Q5HZ65_SANBA|nr:hypothetical protein A7U60_g4101 [Sanghuangporus baumii]